MARKLNLPSQLLEKLETSDDKQWRQDHNYGGKRKSRKESRKEQRNLKKQKRNPSTQQSVKQNKKTENVESPPKKNTKPQAGVKKTNEPKEPKKSNSDAIVRPFVSAHDEELRRKDEEDARYYAKKSGLKSSKLNKGDDGLDDFLGDLDFDNFDEGEENIDSPVEGDDIENDESENISENDSETIYENDAYSDDNEESELDNSSSVAETMAKLAALKKGKTSDVRMVKEDELGDDDDEISEFDGFSNDEDDEIDADDFDDSEDIEGDGDEMTAEETMAKLAASKKAKQNDNASVSQFNKGLNESKGMEPKLSHVHSDTNSNSDAESGSDSGSDSDSDSNPYVPPTRRRVETKSNSTQLSESLFKAQRKFKSALNKLTESTMQHVASEINSEFSNNSRAESSEVFSQQSSELVGGPQPLQHTMYTVYAGLVAALYQSQGVDFGGALLQKLVSAIVKPTGDFKPVGLLSLLVEMYCLHVVGSRLMYDLIKYWLHELASNNEEPVEMLLIVVRDAGSLLRSDDPIGLKETILLVQQRMQQISTSGEVTARTRFMMDSIIASKNNRQKPVSESVISLRHRIRTSKLSNPGESSSARREPLQVGLDDILESDTRGKWWLVGASWKGRNVSTAEGYDDKSDIDLDDEFGATTTNWLELARKQRLNTDVRRAVFVALMGAEDYLDACLRIDKLGLKNRQERDVPYVILHCLTQEPAYNPYYALVAGKQCAKHSLMKTFQFKLWDWFNSEDAKSEIQTAMHYARFYASLTVQRKMPSDVLKMADFLGNDHRVFSEVYLVSLYKDMAREAETAAKKSKVQHGTFGLNEKTHTVERDGKESTVMLTKIQDPKVLRGLQLYHSAVVKSEASRTDKERQRVIWAADLVADVIDELVHRQKD